MQTDKISELQKAFQKIYKDCQNVVKNNEEFSEEDLKVKFIMSEILNLLGYEEDDYRFEKKVERKKPDIICYDDLGVKVVFEFKKPTEKDLRQHQKQLWEKYVVPLRANYGILINGLQLILYERVGLNNKNLIYDLSLDSIEDKMIEEIIFRLTKKVLSLEKKNEIDDYLNKYFKKENRMSLIYDLSKEFFFKDFALEKGSIFENFVKGVLKLFGHYSELSKIKEEDLRFFINVFEFWKKFYAKKPDKIPKSWKLLMESANLKENKNDLYKFMFCLETSYALLTRLIVIKACSDFKFPHVDFRKLIETNIEEDRGTYPLISWGFLIRRLMEKMRNNLVESIFEEDIYYWWTDRFEMEGLLWHEKKERTEKEPVLLEFCKPLREIILTLYKYDFSDLARIKGDLIGDLYQKYFDRETRKALGEFYTPKEVVEYILNAVNYEGEFIKEKRLIDPSCGSGTFLVSALNRYLQSIKKKSDKEGWDLALKDLVNSYKIVGLDIHPFACIMAQIHFMLILLPYYHKALEKDEKFSLKRIPIFRTDSLISERIVLPSTENSNNNSKEIFIKITFPIRNDEIKDKEDFKTIEIKIPSKGDLIRNNLLNNTEEYFCSLQAVFDTVKTTAKNKRKEEEWKISKKILEENLKKYLEKKDFEKLAEQLLVYANDYLNVIKDLKYKLGDGRLVKSIEDVVLATLLKNYVKYNYVVGNPPYVRIQNLDKEQRNYYQNVYKTSHGNYDLYVIFIERGINWLSEDGKFGYICSNQFMKRSYGIKLREYILNNCAIKEIVDFGDTGVFIDATNYACILTMSKKDVKGNFKVVKVVKPKVGILNEIKDKIKFDSYHDEQFDVFIVNQNTLSKEWEFSITKEKDVLDKIKNNVKDLLGEKCDVILGIESGKDSILVGNKKDIDGRIVEFILNGVKEKKYLIEKELLKPLLKGRNVRRWNVIPDNEYVIFPQKVINDKYIPISEEQMKKKYPLTLKFFEEYKKDLEKRLMYQKTAMELHGTWYATMYIPAKIEYERIKILTPALTDKNNFAIDMDNNYFVIGTAGVYGILPKKMDIYYLLGILNSKVSEFYLKHISPIKAGGYYQYSTKFLSRLPILLPKTPSQLKISKSISQKVQKILSLVKIQQKIEKFPEIYLEKYIKKGKETNIKEIKLKKSYKNVIPITDKIIDGEGFSIMIAESEKSISAETEFQKDYVFNCLNGKDFHKDEIIKILIPKDESVIKEILKEFENDKNELKENAIEKLENEINELVYELYELNEEDKKVIEEFLGKF